MGNGSLVKTALDELIWFTQARRGSRRRFSPPGTLRASWLPSAMSYRPRKASQTLSSWTTLLKICVLSSNKRTRGCVLTERLAAVDGTGRGLGLKSEGLLELREEVGRYLLAGRPLHVGDVVELLRDGRYWLGRFDWNGKKTSAPRFVLNTDKLTRLPIDVTTDYLRWPERFN